MDATAPTVITKSPTGINVARNVVIAIQFSEAMNKTATTITINGVTGTLTWNGNNATFTPSSMLAYNTVYPVSASGKDLSGNDLAATAWTFTTLKDEGIISSMLKDSKGNAIANATVTLGNGMTTTTNANGSFEFKNVTSGNYTLIVTKDGYKTITQNVTATPGETTNLGTLSMDATAVASSSDNTLAIAAVVIVVLALLAGAFLVLKRRKKK
jgi:LPXTG-motif cell wall-anchored protein